MKKKNWQNEVSSLLKTQWNITATAQVFFSFVCFFKNTSRLFRSSKHSRTEDLQSQPQLWELQRRGRDLPAVRQSTKRSVRPCRILWKGGLQRETGLATRLCCHVHQLINSTQHWLSRCKSWRQRCEADITTNSSLSLSLFLSPSVL